MTEPIEKRAMFGWRPGATRKMFADEKVKYIVGLETKMGWQVITKSPTTNDHYEFDSIVLARKWARTQINTNRFTRLVIYKKSKKGYTYMGLIKFTTEYSRPKWKFVWISKDGDLNEVRKDGTLGKI